jgi:hypothetical protein
MSREEVARRQDGLLPAVCRTTFSALGMPPHSATLPARNERQAPAQATEVAVFSYAIMLGHARRNRDRRAVLEGYCFVP